MQCVGFKNTSHNLLDSNKKIQFHNHFNPHKTLNLFAIKFNKNSINNVLIIKIYVPW